MSVESIIGIISGLISIGGLFLALYNRYKQQSLADLLVKLTDSSLSTKEHQKILKKMNRKLVGAHIKSEYIQGFALKNRGKEAILAHLQSSVSHYPKILHNLNMKNGRSDTPLS